MFDLPLTGMCREMGTPVGGHCWRGGGGGHE
jgi:hypothetical protein